MDTDSTHLVTHRDLHDLRNRVAVIKGFAQLLERQLIAAPDRDDRVSRRIGILRAEIERLEELVAGLGSAAPSAASAAPDDPATD